MKSGLKSALNHFIYYFEYSVHLRLEDFPKKPLSSRFVLTPWVNYRELTVRQ